jgi:hypothetical protein
MGRKRVRQGELFTATADLARSPGQPFYLRLNQLLGEAEFDRWIEAKCAPHYGAADKGFHSAAVLELCDAVNIRTYIPEPKMPRGRVWSDKPEAQQRIVYENRRRMKRAKGKRLGRLRSERVERTFAHVCDAGGMRRSRLRGLVDVTKRYLIAAAAHNLGRILFKLFGIAKPRSLQGGRAPTSPLDFLFAPLLITLSTIRSLRLSAIRIAVNSTDC